jgi:hypothetical protein
MEETEERVRLIAKSGELSVELTANLIGVIGVEVPEAVFDGSVAVFLGVEFRGEGGQFFDQDLRVTGQVGFDYPRAMNLGAIPDDNERTADLAADVVESLDDLWAFDAAFEVALVYLAGDAQSHQGGNFASKLADPFEQRGLASGCPSGCQILVEGVAKLVNEDHYCP